MEGLLLLFVVASVGLFVIGSIIERNPGLLYLLALPLAIVLLPFKLAGDILKAERRSRNKRKGRHR